MQKTESAEKLKSSVREFTDKFDQVSAPMFAALIEATQGCSSYDSDILKLVASPTLMCNNCSETGDVVKRDVVFLNNEPVMAEARNQYRKPEPAETIVEAMEALKERVDDFRETVDVEHRAPGDAPEREETDAEVLERLEEELEIEDLYVCTSCGGTEEDASPGEPQYAFPVAWNTMFHDREGFLRGRESLATDCGFFVFESEYYSGAILGVDGAGYSFHDQHFAPLYAALGLRWHEVS